MKKIFQFLIPLMTIVILSGCFHEHISNEEDKVQYATIPTVENVVMYEIFVRNFTSEGTLNAIIPQLDRLKAMGVNTLWLMPIQPIGVMNKKGTYGSPYSIQNYTQINPAFGTKADFKKLVDSVHAKEMYIIIDEVANHTSWDHPWIKSHPDWYTHDSTGKIIPPVPDWSDVADLNFENQDLRKEMITEMQYWVDSFNIDGYRCDAASMVPNDFWKDCIATLRKSRPLLMLAESEDPKMYDNGFDMTYGWRMYGVLKNIWKGDSSSGALKRCVDTESVKFPPEYKPLRFVTDHDENSWDDVPQNKFVSIAGEKAAFITMMTLPGVPFIYQGQEVAYPTKINLFEKYKIDWTANPDLQKWYAQVLGFYDNSLVLKRGIVDQFDDENSKVLIYQRQLLGTHSLWVIVNTSNSEVTANLPPSLQNKKIQDVITEEGMQTEKVMKLRPFEFHILRVG